MSNYRVIHVDDDRAFLDLAATKLEQYPSITVESETSIQACLECLSGDRRIDCFVSDYDMPEMTGLELLDQVRDIKPDFPFILFTGKGSEEIASRAISAGVTDYLSKHKGSNQFELLANRIRNYAEQFRTKRFLERHRRRNKHALQAVSDVVWEYSPTTGELEVSEGFSEVTGYDVDDVNLSLEWWDDHVHPDDRNRIRTDFDEWISAGQTTFSKEYCLRSADGSYILVENNGYILYDEDDNPHRIIGAIRDITDQRERQQELERYRQVIDTVAAGVFVLNEAGEFDLVNHRLEELTG
ncbi:PAS domain-containing response regulator [Halobellus litoreus]|uniref:histidine kinase n=1 Tax=Halobellus litoreus TaxID=755310 RepID=A0ABD6E0C4_9EURY|nr:PAS domain-containing protein [Halobellus litoreus]